MHACSRGVDPSAGGHHSQRVAIRHVWPIHDREKIAECNGVFCRRNHAETAPQNCLEREFPQLCDYKIYSKDNWRPSSIRLVTLQPVQGTSFAHAILTCLHKNACRAVWISPRRISSCMVGHQVYTLDGRAPAGDRQQGQQATCAGHAAKGQPAAVLHATQRGCLVRL
jgi:hypothetical protein